MNAYEELRHAAETAVADFIGVSDADFIVRYLQRALKKPRRNCDVGTPAEQQIRFAKFCLYIGKTCDTCPAAKMGYEKGVKCSFVWGQMPYTEGETK